MKNLELKSHWKNLDKAKLICSRIGARYNASLNQVDTFYNIKGTRLKIRNVNKKTSELIYYLRPDSKYERESNYEIVKLTNERIVKKIFKHALGVRGVVKKVRELYIWQNVRIHLDKVKGLGTFIEFEIACNTNKELKEAPKQMSYLKKEFAIKQKELISKSYIDLISR